MCPRTSLIIHGLISDLLPFHVTMICGVPKTIPATLNYKDVKVPQFLVLILTINVPLDCVLKHMVDVIPIITTVKLVMTATHVQLEKHVPLVHVVQVVSLIVVILSQMPNVNM
jgi:hypothetical protein